jgi:acetylglutamate/LysW-gamma-L-alpha-aminoadipate kinase
VILSNVPGLLRDAQNGESLIEQLPAGQLEEARNRYAQGRMRIKLLAAEEALQGGVQRVIIGDARLGQPIQRALARQGTVIEPEEVMV